KGYLEPCGCTSRPLGGIDRLAARVKALRSDGVPTAVIAAGDLWFGDGKDHGGVEGAEAQERLQAEALAAILEDVGLVALAPGPHDRAAGAETLESLARASGAAALGASDAELGKLVTVGSHKFGVVGALDA